MVDFLLELGTEEIPAFYIEPACSDLLERILSALEEEGLIDRAGGTADGARTAATPRRLAIFVPGLPERQPDREEDVSGPPERAAFDKDGNPTKAAIGFARGQGAEVGAIEIRETPKGRYCFVHKKIAGQATAAVLSRVVPDILPAVHFPKSMRWSVAGSPRAVEALSFARPIRSMVALLGEEVVPFTVNGVAAGRTVFGHPFLAPGPIEIGNADFGAYIATLRERFVIADVEERRGLVRDGVIDVLKKHDSSLEEDGLVDEVTNLVEFPVVVEGSFDESYLVLPAEVIKSAMMDHQRYFPVESGKGRLAARFVTVTNRGPEHAAGIREGNERVLAARLADAAFFLKEDRKLSLADRVEDLAGIVYQEKLGTYLARVERLEKLAAFLADVIGLSAEEKTACTRAARLCKCDLTTEMVGEFPNLQGIVGREYALRDGETPVVAAALEEHYLPAFAGDRLPASAVGKVLALAEKCDTIVGCFAAGLSPTGSQDPYGLRRQALGILRIILEGNLNISLRETFHFAAGNLPEGLPSAELLESRVLDFFWDRLYNVFFDKGYRYDLIKAALATGFDDIHVFRKRLDALRILADEPGWVELVTVVQRTFNIFKKAGEVGAVNEECLEAAEEKEVFRVYKECEPEFRTLIDKGDYAAASREFAKRFVKPVHSFFEKVFVNVDDEDVKNNRLALMKSLNRLYAVNIADLSEVVTD
jgi:glycyl-tRNA synthetase beta chain